MSDNSAGTNAGAWGTLSWFSHQFSSRPSDDPAAYYSHAVNGYQRFRHAQLSMWLKRAVGEKTAPAIVDIGCGSGELTARLAKELDATRVKGFDFLPDAIREANSRHPEFEFATGTLPAIQLDDGEQDLVVASEVIYYLNDEQRDEALAEIWRVLRPGGALLFASRLGGRYFSPESAERLLAKRLRIESRHFLHNRLFEQLSKPIRGVRRAGEIARGDTDASRPRLTKLIHRYRLLLNNPLVGLLTQLVGAAERRLLKSSWLPAACHHVCRLMAPRTTRTGVVVIARKD